MIDLPPWIAHPSDYAGESLVQFAGDAGPVLARSLSAIARFDRGDRPTIRHRIEAGDTRDMLCALFGLPLSSDVDASA